MGWEGVTIMDQRVRFIAEYLRDFFLSRSFVLNLVSAGRPVISG
jgi:hypothetical protein